MFQFLVLLVLLFFVLLFLMNKTQSRSTTFSRWTSCEMHHKMGYELNWLFYWPWGKRNGGRSSFKWVLNLDWMSKMWSHCMKAVGDWFSSCEENIILHTLQSIRFWDCIFSVFSICFCIPCTSFFFFFLLYFFFRDRAGWISVWMPNHLCVPESQILFLSTTVENTNLARYYRNIFKNQLGVLGWVSSIIL